MYPHVFRATIIEGGWHRFIRSVLPIFPSFIQRAVRKVWPRYALPPCVVLKKLRDPFVDRKDLVSKKREFENEKAMYQELQCLQEIRIPTLYGEGRCDGKRTLVLSYIAGGTLRQQSPPRLTVEEFEQRLRPAVEDIANFGLGYDDIRLSNILLVDARIAFIDLECVCRVKPVHLELNTKCTIGEFVDRYKDYLPHADDEWS
ncbi:Protein kinase-like domain protein [Niveomyces insectorum RCEF 264]|uniref:Protein kinase-like domain protein n=1 Tax=Niveomyces insectorum RCEF 264 TaxID=1081102 RepID=A0A167N2J4_9HYPO|nr:Protein kinase-like domain protein [Niveomyces insectorum RCEF 264]